MKNTATVFLTLLSYFYGFTQVGINTTTPQNDLHVNGTLQITGPLNLGGNATSSGSNGNPGETLISQGDNLPPIWGINTYIKFSAKGEMGENVNSDSTLDVIPTGSKLTLKKGKWIIYAGVVYRSNTTTVSRFFMNLYLSSSQTSLSNTGYTTLDQGTIATSGNEIIKTVTSNNADPRYSMITGMFKIEVLNDELVLFVLADSKGKESSFTLGGSEDYLFAIPVY